MPVAHVDEYKVLHISTLGKEKDGEARELLERVAKQVQPIMRKRQWTVHKLSEFIPRSPNLLGLNVNRGREVKIRLRPVGRQHSFYDWNHILGTMLHELCHNRIGPHNAEFYKLLDELWTEAEELMDKGISGSGQGFDAPSTGRLGSHAFIPTHNPPDHKLADVVRKAAEARAHKQRVMPAGPCKLGGSSSYTNMSPAQAAAAAAERRARDNLWCGAEHSVEQVAQEVDSATGTGRSSSSSSRSTSPAPAAAPAAVLAGAGVSGVGRQPPVYSELGEAGVSAVGRQSTQLQAAGVRDDAQTAAAAGQAALQCLQQQRLRLQQQQQQEIHLKELWQQRLQRSRQQRQQLPRKRPADEIDLTLSDDEGEATCGISEGKCDNLNAGCPCCSAVIAPVDDAAAGDGPLSGEAWCDRHRWQRQQQQQLDPLRQDPQQQQLDRRREDLCWVCQVCTLVNKPLVLLCEACLSVRNTQ